MSKRVLVVNEPERGQSFIFETVEEASKALGMNPSTISRAVRDATECKGYRVRYAERVFAVRPRAGREWRVVVLNSRGTAYVVLGEPSLKVGKREVAEIKDITAVWYYGK